MLKHALLPVWDPFTHVCWVSRNALTNRRPVRVPAGSEMVLLHPEGQIAEALWVSGFEAAERKLVARVARPGMRVLNIGANIGLYTAMAAKLIGPTGEVHAFEPSTTTFVRLKRNMRLNNLTNVLLNNVALSDATGRLILRSDPKNRAMDGHRFVESMDESGAMTVGDEVIDCDTLDMYFSRIAGGKLLPTIDLMIMDVEGAEWAVLKGATRVLKASTNLLIVLECSQNREEVGELLSKENFRFYAWNSVVSRLESVGFVPGAASGTVIAYRGNPDECLS